MGFPGSHQISCLMNVQVENQRRGQCACPLIGPGTEGAQTRESRVSEKEKACQQIPRIRERVFEPRKQEYSPQTIVPRLPGAAPVHPRGPQKQSREQEAAETGRPAPRGSPLRSHEG